MDFQQLEQLYSVVLCRWNNGILVKPSKPICEIEEKSLSRAYFMVFNRRGKFCIHLSGLCQYEVDEQNNQLFVEKSGKQVRKTTYYPLKSSRLKHTKTIEAALSWINRFRHLSDNEQDEVLGRHEVSHRDNQLVALFCDYWRLEYWDKDTNKWELLDTSIDHKKLQGVFDSLRNKDKYRLVPSVHRHFMADKTSLQQWVKDKTIYSVNISASPVKNATMGVTDYNKTPKRNRTAKFWNRK